MTNMPLKKFKAGSIETAIWSNKKKIGNSEIEFKTVSLTRSWKKSPNDVWRNDSVNFKRNELQKAILVLQKAQEELLLTEKEEDAGDE